MLEGNYLERFHSRIVKPDDEGCWEWDGAHFAAGYAESWDGERPRYAHRVSYELQNGPIPDGLVIDHLCDNKGCVNPDHLQATTHRENILRGDGASSSNLAKTRCVRGHEFTDDNTHVNSDGQRECRKCWSVRGREARTHCPSGHEYRENSYKLDKLGRRRCQLCLNTHCSKGHPYDDANTYVAPSGERQCRECSREATRRWRRRQRQSGG